VDPATNSGGHSLPDVPDPSPKPTAEVMAAGTGASPISRGFLRFTSSARKRRTARILSKCGRRFSNISCAASTPRAARSRSSSTARMTSSRSRQARTCREVWSKRAAARHGVFGMWCHRQPVSSMATSPKRACRCVRTKAQTRHAFGDVLAAARAGTDDRAVAVNRAATDRATRSPTWTGTGAHQPARPRHGESPDARRAREQDRRIVDAERDDGRMNASLEDAQNRSSRRRSSPRSGRSRRASRTRSTTRSHSSVELVA